MANYFSDNPDLVFQWNYGVRWAELAAASELDFTLPGGHRDVSEARAFYDQVITLIGDLAANQIAPRAKALAAAPAHLENGQVAFAPAMDEIIAKFRDADFFGMCVPRELGGSNCPLALSFISGEILARADVSVMTHLGFYGGTATALLAYSAFEGSTTLDRDRRIEETRFAREVRDIVAGKNHGCMVLTEPDAGSDLGALRTRAVQREGRWYLTGNKIFITSGEGQYALVLARSEPPSPEHEGLKGLSLFLARRQIERGGRLVDNVRIDKVEHKMGHAGSPTCALVFEDSEAELIGQRGQGFELMLHMMNGARIAVGFEAIGVCEAAKRMAFDYAGQRKTMGKAIAEHELVAEMLFDIDLDICGLRALAFACINWQELAYKYDFMLRTGAVRDDDARRALSEKLAKAKRRGRDLTPLLKYLAAEKAVEIARKNMQIHGGAGYMVEVGAERLMREALVIPVYEGTSQIQALMALKDQLMHVLREPSRFARRMSAASLKMTTAKTAAERGLNHARLELSRALTHLVGRIAGKKLRQELTTALRSVPAHDWPRYMTHDFMREWDARADFAYGLLHAERVTRMLADIEISSALLKQASEHPERRAYAERYIQRMLPRVRALSDEVRSGDTTVLEWIRERAQRVPAEGREKKSAIE